MSKETDIYTCEKILKKRIKKGHVEYLIKWKDYPIKESTWEPERNIIDRDLLTLFENKSKRKKLSKRKPTRRSSQTLATGSPQENRDESSIQLTSSPTPSTPTSKTRTPTPALSEPHKSPRETVERSPPNFVPLSSPSIEIPTKIRPTTPKPELKPENGVMVLYKSQPSPSVKIHSPMTRTSEVQTSPRPSLSSLNTINERPFTVITDVTVNSRTITISESLCRAP